MENLVNLSIVTGLVIGMTQCLKIAGVKVNWLPLCGLGIGILFSFLIKDVSIVGGIVASLSAFGLYRKVELTTTTS